MLAGGKANIQMGDLMPKPGLLFQHKSVIKMPQAYMLSLIV